MQAYIYPLQLGYSMVDHYLYGAVETGKAELAEASKNAPNLNDMVEASVPDKEDIVVVFVLDMEGEPILHKVVKQQTV